jgi:hypothetical protein
VQDPLDSKPDSMQIVTERVVSVRSKIGCVLGLDLSDLILLQDLLHGRKENIEGQLASRVESRGHLMAPPGSVRLGDWTTQSVRKSPVRVVSQPSGHLGRDRRRRRGMMRVFVFDVLLEFEQGLEEKFARRFGCARAQLTGEVARWMNSSPELAEQGFDGHGFRTPTTGARTRAVNAVTRRAIAATLA